MRCRRRPTLPRPLGRSTIGAVGLNDRVRDGNGCGPYALIASDFLCDPRIARFASRMGAPSCGRSAKQPADDRIIMRVAADLESEGRGRVRYGIGVCDAHSRIACSAVEIFALVKPESSQAARAIRTAALGGCRQPSTGGLSTWSSPTALQGARSPGEGSSRGRLPT